MDFINAAIAATLEGRAPTPLSEFLSALPGSWEMQIFYGLMGSGLAGMLAHYVLKWARDEIQGNLFCYWIANFKRTVLSFLTFTGIAWTAAFNDAFEGDFGGFVGWKMVLTWGWGIGLSIDVIVNKSDRSQWPLAKRIAEKRRREAVKGASDDLP